MTGLPPSLAGGVKTTLTWPLPATAVPMLGAPGSTAGAALFDHVMRSRERMHRVRGAGATTPASIARVRSKR